MREPPTPVQRDEVIKTVESSSDRSCAIVHPASRCEVVVFAVEARWMVRAILMSRPSPAVLRTLKPARLKHAAREMKMHFGPDAGKTVSFHEIKGQFNDLSSAAVAALALARRLAGVADTEWLWVTHFEPDDRPDEPPKPPEPEGIEGRDTRRTK